MTLFTAGPQIIVSRQEADDLRVAVFRRRMDILQSFPLFWRLLHPLPLPIRTVFKILIC
jgi:hypothetical protein